MSGMRNKRTRRFKSEINVVPYIDVMLVLLVIFMVVAPMTTPGMLNLPRAENTAQPPTEYIEIVMRINGEYEIGVKQSKQTREGMQKAINHDDLFSKLRSLHRQNPNTPVLISAEDKNEYGEVVKLISDTKKIGINRVGLATR